MNKLREDPNVIDAFMMKQNLRIKVELEESDITATAGITYENSSLPTSRRKDISICVFSKTFLEVPTTSQMVLADDEGVVCGELLSRYMSRSVVKEKGGVWIATDFVVYPDIKITSEPHFIIKPVGYAGLGEAEGVKDVIMYNPAKSTDEMLKAEYGMPQTIKITSTVLMMDRL